MTEQGWLASDDPVSMVKFFTSLTTGTNPARPFAHKQTDDRKLRLYACACWRHLWPEDTAAVTAVEEWVEGRGERPEVPKHWVNQSSAEEAARDAAHGMWPNDHQRGAKLLREIVPNPFRPAPSPEPPRDTAGAALWPTVLDLARDAYEVRVGRPHKRCQCGRAYEMAARKSTPPIAWCNHCRKDGGFYAAAVAQEDGSLDPARLAVLADSLEDAGVTDQALLRHLRGWERCHACLLHPGKQLIPRGEPSQGSDEYGCLACVSSPYPDAYFGTGWVKLPGPHVRGCWALDLILGRN